MPLLFAHYFEAKVWRRHLLEYSIHFVHMPPSSFPCNLFIHARLTITMTVVAIWKNSSIAECVLREKKKGLC